MSWPLISPKPGLKRYSSNQLLSLIYYEEARKRAYEIGCGETVKDTERENSRDVS